MSTLKTSELAAARAAGWTYASLGARLPKGFKFRGRPWRTTASYEYMHAIRTGVPLGWSGIHVETCEEHDCQEAIPTDNWPDVQPWYKAGRHPRWSLYHTLMSPPLNQRMWETQSLVRGWNRAGDDGIVVQLLKQSTSRSLFVRRIAPHVSVWLRHQGRRVRVPASFAAKYRKNAFTAKDFLTETNQERRRLMLRHGVEPADVRAKLGPPIAEDAEGRLYEFQRQRYLDVTCPSTGEQYLLAVPRRDWDRETQNSVGLDTPAKARRWTFQLPMDAQFVAEA